MTVLLDNPELVELTVTRPEIDPYIEGFEAVRITGQDAQGEYFRVSIDLETYLSVVGVLEYDWSTNLIVKTSAIVGSA